jgi:hypothetical protein
MIDAIIPPAVAAFLRERGAESIPHPGGTLFHHLVRTAATLAQWACATDVILAGLCHATYGTDGFPTSLLAIDDRVVLRSLIGSESEAVVYCYGASDRALTWPLIGDLGPVPYRDRFTDQTRGLGPDEAGTYWTITVANELDLIDKVPHGRAILPALESGAHLLPPLAATALRHAQLIG